MIHPKLRGMPHIYYINLEKEIIRKEWMETQFSKFGIKNFTRINASKYLKEEFDEWSKDIIHHPEFYRKEHHKSVSVSVSHLETIRIWLETTNNDYMIIMEDDIDLRLVHYWHFDWEYLMNNIPKDWDGVQLMYNSNYKIYCFLHVKQSNSFNGPLLINKNYAKKLVSLYYSDGKYNLLRKLSDVSLAMGNTVSDSFYVVDVDNFMGFHGKVYQLPLFTQNTDLDRIQRDHHIKSRRAHLIWWTQMRDMFTLEEFFRYNKPNDDKMTLTI